MLPAWLAPRVRRHREGLVPLDDALQALGDNGRMGRRIGDVPVADIVGSAARATDFDEQFGLVNTALRPRWEELARAVDAGLEPPPVQLVQLGELYFVEDGHHRVSVARARGRHVVTARVRRICTIAYAKACLRAADLASKAAERRFLERVPLPDEHRTDLWLSEPAQWARLADTAEAWGLRRVLEHGRTMSREQLAARWWAEEVTPLVSRLRDDRVGVDLRDVQLYVTALAVRDRGGPAQWPEDVSERLAAARPTSRRR